jgi:hypothetical protein
LATKSGRPAREKYEEHPGKKYGFEKRYQKDISAAKALKDAEKAGRKQAKADAAAENSQREARGSRQLADLEDQQRRRDIAEENEMRDPSAGYAAAQAETAVGGPKRGRPRSGRMQVQVEDEEERGDALEDLPEEPSSSPDRRRLTDAARGKRKVRSCPRPGVLLLTSC